MGEQRLPGEGRGMSEGAAVQDGFGHASFQDLAVAAEGLLDPTAAAHVEHHLAQCPVCRRRAAALLDVTETLAAEPSPPMPAEVVERIGAALAAEAARRAIGPSPAATGSRRDALRRPSLGAVEAGQRSARTGRRLLVGLVAAGAAALVGFGGYAVSSAAGLNEPPVVASVTSSRLAAQAATVEEAGIGSHVFSRAWLCARQVSDGPISGIAAARVDGSPALLVYTRESGTTTVTVVTGCSQGTPTAGPSATLDR